MDCGTRQGIYDKTDIVEVISKVLPLKGNDSVRRGMCPFHADKSPSLCVYLKSQYFCCFGCGANGDVIRFVQRFYRLSFRDALSKLGIRPGRLPVVDAATVFVQEVTP